MAKNDIITKSDLRWKLQYEDGKWQLESTILGIKKTYADTQYWACFYMLKSFVFSSDLPIEKKNKIIDRLDGYELKQKALQAQKFADISSEEQPTADDTECERKAQASNATEATLFDTNEQEKDNVNHPSHYAWLKDAVGVEPNEILRFFPYNKGAALKYIIRSGRKASGLKDLQASEIEDLQKAVFYLTDEISRLQGVKKQSNTNYQKQL